MKSLEAGQLQPKVGDLFERCRWDLGESAATVRYHHIIGYPQLITPATKLLIPPLTYPLDLERYHR